MISRDYGGAVAQLVERATPGEEVPNLIPAVVARSPLVVMVSPLCLMWGSTWEIVRRQSWDPSTI